MDNKASLNSANPDKADLTNTKSSKGNSGRADSGKADAEFVWKQLEDVVVPRLRLSVIERDIYYHLLRDSRLEGKLRYHFSIASLGRRTSLSLGPVRRAIHRLMAQGALRLIRRSKAGHFVEVRVPEEIRAARSAAEEVREAAHLVYKKPQPSPAVPLDEVDFLQTRELRRAIHAREGRRCFYCLCRQVTLNEDRGPRRAALALGRPFLPQPGLRLLGLQFPERREAGGGFPALAVPRTPLDRCRTERAGARFEGFGDGQAAARASGRRKVRKQKGSRDGRKN